jgi:hypothetical protein
MFTKWTGDEELKLIRMLTNKKSLKEISRDLKRTENAVEQRINKIIYENIKNSGKTPKMVATALNMQEEDVNSYFKAREEYIKQNLKRLAKDIGGETEITKREIVENIEDNLTGGTKQKKEIVENIEGDLTGGTKQKKEIVENIEDNLTGGTKQKKETPKNALDKKDILLSRLEYENRFIRTLIENKVLHKQLNKLIKDGKIDPNVKILLKKLNM